MLVEIVSDKFREKRITFQEGLNIVLGDEKATNSIGKSTLLAVIDFVFGGGTFNEHYQNVTEALGHHDYFFCFQFEGKKFYFRRPTFDTNVVYKCDENYKDIKDIHISDFTNFLATKYQVAHLPLSFRSMVGVYARIWLKPNLEVRTPLHSHHAEKDADAVETLIKLFNKYDDLAELYAKQKNFSEAKKSLSAAHKYNYIPKITKTAYNENQRKIALIQDEVLEIQSNLAKYAVNLQELVNRQILDLKEEKDTLVSYKADAASRLRRVSRNLAAKSYIQAKNLAKLEEFFPTVDKNRVAKIEAFHEGLQKILTKELRQSEEALKAEVSEIESAISKLDEKINAVVSNKIANPNVIIDRVVKLQDDLHIVKQENNYYDTNETVSTNLKKTKGSLEALRQKTLETISGSINNVIRELTTKIFSKDRKSARLSFKGSSYSYETFDDTGTGKAYSDLIIFDLAILNLTKLPILIHDSLLFKNIENAAVSKILVHYNEQVRQIFISIDEGQKYGTDVRKVIEERTVISLAADRLLYIKDWRSKNKN